VNHRQAAPTPPMGWNSWDCYGAAVTEEEIRGNAEYMAEHLKDYGWDTVVVDIQWYEPGANSAYYRSFVPLEMDEYSRLLPAVNRFPSTSDGRGFKPLADEVHSLGLKFGIHIMRGIPRQAVHMNTPIKNSTATARDIAANSICPWNTDMYGVDASNEGARAYYDSLFELYASWGVDFVKVDDIAASKLYASHLSEIELIRQAIDKCGRPMVLSLSPGPAPVEYADFFANHANMWRLTDDFWDRWDLLLDMFDRCESWQGLSGDGGWPDCDMLPLGHICIRTGPGEDRWTRFTREEQLTMMTLWALFRSPLFFGGELRDNDEWTLSLLTNRSVFEMHRNSHGAKRIFREGNRIVWSANGPAGVRYVAMFNTGERETDITIPLTHLDVTVPVTATELWENTHPTQLDSEISARVAPHGTALFRLNPAHN